MLDSCSTESFFVARYHAMMGSSFSNPSAVRPISALEYSYLTGSYHRLVTVDDELVHRAHRGVVPGPATEQNREALAAGWRPDAVEARRHPPVRDDLRDISIGKS